MGVRRKGRMVGMMDMWNTSAGFRAAWETRMRRLLPVGEPGTGWLCWRVRAAFGVPRRVAVQALIDEGSESGEDIVPV